MTLRQSHAPGERLFVDYAGQTVGVVDADTGEVRQAQVFVAVLGASNYTYVEATSSQGLADWIGAHVRAFEFFGGVPELVVPDNLKSGVTRPSFYDPELNPSYRDLAAHYGVTVLPARVRKPRDKAKVETGVLVVSSSAPMLSGANSAISAFHPTSRHFTLIPCTSPAWTRSMRSIRGGTPPIHIPLRLLAAILSRMRSPVEVEA